MALMLLVISLSAECQFPNICKNRKLPSSVDFTMHCTNIALEQLGMMIDIALGLEYLHERTPKVIHRDVSIILQLHSARY
jgi:hypothetical protein